MILAAVACSVFLAVDARSFPTQTRTETETRSVAALDALHRWVNAVEKHVPGKADESVQVITAMTYGARRELNTPFSLFIRVLRDETVRTRNDIEKAVADLGRGVRANPGITTFLKRAAVLHFDALVFADEFPVAPDDAPPAETPRGADFRGTGVSVRRTETPPPLLTNDRIVLTRDGQMYGDQPADWNLPFARSLLDLLLKLPGVSAADRAFVGQWYHAVSAYLFARGNFGDSTSHLHHAEEILRDDADVMFDRGCYAETLALPIYQVVRDDPKAWRPNGPVTGIPSEGSSNAEAERLFRRALEIDPGYMEARIRLARVLDHRGQHDEAAAEIARVLEKRPSGSAGFYALIVAGRIAAARGRHGEALLHYRAASALYPDAQSALLGASQAALMLADVTQTLVPLDRIGRDRGAFDTDPWWDYALGAGRDADAVLAALWARVAR